jgi:hypothetical protein
MDMLSRLMLIECEAGIVKTKVAQALAEVDATHP